MKTTLELPDDVYRQAKALAVLKGQTMKDWLTEVLRREVAAGQAKAMPADQRAAQADEFVREMRRLAALVSEDWQGPQDAVQAVREQRRDHGA